VEGDVRYKDIVNEKTFQVGEKKVWNVVKFRKRMTLPMPRWEVRSWQIGQLIVQLQGHYSCVKYERLSGADS